MERYIEFILNHYILSLALAVVTYMLIQELVDSAFKKYTALSPQQAVVKMNDDSLVIIDVREPHEFVESHIEQATNIALSKFDESLTNLERNKTKPIIIVCQNGTRSAAAAKKLTKAGFEKVSVLIGGMDSWRSEERV